MMCYVVRNDSTYKIGCCDWIYSNPMTKYVTFSMLGFKKHFIWRFGVSHLSIPGIVVHGSCYIPVILIFFPIGFTCHIALLHYLLLPISIILLTIIIIVIFFMNAFINSHVSSNVINCTIHLFIVAIIIIIIIITKIILIYRWFSFIILYMLIIAYMFYNHHLLFN